tara:strand:- start:215 stop:418 length:204 start_codon:yes stop_codon:yes gene_type:complete
MYRLLIKHKFIFVSHPFEQSQAKPFSTPIFLAIPKGKPPKQFKLRFKPHELSTTPTNTTKWIVDKIE